MAPIPNDKRICIDRTERGISVNGFSNYVVEERARKLIVKSYSMQEREREFTSKSQMR